MGEFFYDSSWIASEGIARLLQPNTVLSIDLADNNKRLTNLIAHLPQPCTIKQVNCRNCGALAIEQCEYCGTMV